MQVGVPRPRGAEPAPPEIIDPPQYSVAWLILAALCVIVVAALIVGTLRITRGIERRIAYRARPTDVDTLKAEFLRAVNDLADRHEAGELDAREGHQELTAIMRRQLDDVHAAGREPVAALWAAEAGIYGRFGYAPATWRGSWSADPTRLRSALWNYNHSKAYVDRVLEVAATA